MAGGLAGAWLVGVGSEGLLRPLGGMTGIPERWAEASCGSLTGTSWELAGAFEGLVGVGRGSLSI